MKVDKRLIAPHQKYVARNRTVIKPRVKEYRPEPSVQTISFPPHIVVSSVDWDTKHPKLDTIVLFLDHRDYYSNTDEIVTYRTLDGHQEVFQNRTEVYALNQELRNENEWLRRELLMYTILKPKPLFRADLLAVVEKQNCMSPKDASIALGFLIQRGAACYRAGDGRLKTTQPKHLL